MTFLCIECGKKIDESNFFKKVKIKYKDCLNKKQKVQVCGKFFTKKWLTSHVERDHQKESNSSVLKKPKVDIVNTNNWTHLVGPGFSGETFLMLKILSWTPDRDIYIITKSPPEQYSSSEIKIKEIGDETKPLGEYENPIIVFDDISGSSNSRDVYQFFIRARHKNLDIYYLSKFYFDLPKRTKRKNSNKFIVFSQTLKDIENIYRDVGGYDMSYDEFKQIEKSWEEDYYYLCIDRSKKKRSRKILYW